jgi:predicted DNA-binding antitoxin AbrB/MazE fold protein
MSRGLDTTAAIEAIFEKGRLRPLKALPLEEGAQVRLRLEVRWSERATEAPVRSWSKILSLAAFSDSKSSQLDRAIVLSLLAMSIVDLVPGSFSAGATFLVSLPILFTILSYRALKSTPSVMG